MFFFKYFIALAVSTFLTLALPGVKKSFWFWFWFHTKLYYTILENYFELINHYWQILFSQLLESKSETWSGQKGVEFNCYRHRYHISHTYQIWRVLRLFEQFLSFIKKKPKILICPSWPPVPFPRPENMMNKQISSFCNSVYNCVVYVWSREFCVVWCGLV